MALIYREHRGSFEESIKTARRIRSRAELDADRFVEYGWDRRLNSATTAVIKDGAIIGFITREVTEQWTLSIIKISASTKRKII